MLPCMQIKANRTGTKSGKKYKNGKCGSANSVEN